MGRRRHQKNAPARTTPSEATTPTSPPVRKPRRLWLFRTIAIVFPFALLLIAEWSLRWAGKGIDSTLVQKSQRSPAGNVYYLNPQVDVAYSKQDLRGPEPRGFELPRPADLIRVVVIGESSVQGYPHSSELAFPRQMELVLQKQLPDKRVEVLNAGIIGVSSLPLTDVVQQCVAAEPSVIVIYAGHNEFYGVGGVATNASLSSIAIPLRKTRLIQWLSDGDARTSDKTVHSQNPLISRMPKEFQIPSTSPLALRALDNYRSRMRWIADFCSRKKIPLILCSPVSNLRSQSPWAHDELLAATKYIEKRVNAPLSQASSEAWQAELEKAVVANPTNAVLQYRLAQCLEYRGDHERAYRHYETARDMDYCRYRAPTSFATILSEISHQYSKDVTYLDLEPTFRAESPRNIPGEELFLEHVHFTLDGHWLMARSIARTIVEKTLQSNWDSERVPSDSDRDDWLGLIPEDRLVGLYLASFIGEVAPFNEALDAETHVASLKSKIEELEKTFFTERLKQFHSLHNAVKIDDLVDGLGRIQLGLKKPTEALAYFEKSTHRRPWMPNGFLFCAIACEMAGEHERARVYLAQSKTTVIAETPRLLKDQQQLETQMRLRSLSKGKP